MPKLVSSLLFALTLLHLAPVPLGFASAQAGLTLCAEAGTLTQNTDGSFYYSSDLRYGADLGELTVWMNRLNDVFREDGTLLVIVPTPLRGMVNGGVVNDTAALEALEINFDVNEAQTYYQSYVASLEPMFAVDLLEAATSLNGQTPGYHLKLDRHWTPEGSRVTAQAVARALLVSPEYNALQPPERTPFATVRVGEEPAANKIFEIIEKNCGDVPDELMEMMSSYQTGREVELALFGSETPFVTLVGGSFSGEKYNFAGFLSQALGQEVVNNSVSGGGLFIPLQDYLLNTPPGSRAKVIIWEYRMTDATGAGMTEDFTPFRELIPAVYGDCSAKRLVSRGTDVSGTTLRVLESDDPDVYGEGYYLQLQASDLSLVEFEIALTHQDGSVDRAAIERSTRVSNTGTFFLELSREISSPLKEVSLSLPAGVTGTVEAQLCRVPGA